jgi:hypothetical protein
MVYSALSRSRVIQLFTLLCCNCKGKAGFLPHSTSTPTLPESTFSQNYRSFCASQDQNSSLSPSQFNPKIIHSTSSNSLHFPAIQYMAEQFKEGTLQKHMVYPSSQTLRLTTYSLVTRSPEVGKIKGRRIDNVSQLVCSKFSENSGS